ncbi:MAG: hypothetical protein AAGH74_04065 [Pseudomonadota bacterium]
MSRLLILIAVACSFLIGAVHASAEPRQCYWNVDGLPYSMETPSNATEDEQSLTLVAMLYVMFANSPELVVKSACQDVVETDLEQAREIYRHWGCSRESSIGRMIEGLPTGGVFISSWMTAYQQLYENNPVFSGELCQLVKETDSVCFRTELTGVEDFDKELHAKYPNCALWWSRPFAAKFKTLITPEIKEMRARDRALIDAANEQ